MLLIGVDGAKRGNWVLATVEAGASGPPAFELTLDLSGVFKRAAAGGALVVIDVPIGILSGMDARSGRAWDSAA